MKILSFCLLITLLVFPLFAQQRAPAFPQQQQQPGARGSIPPPQQRQRPFANRGNDQPFLHPGVIIEQGERWVGSDFLGHLSPYIGIEMEVLQSHQQGEPLNIDQRALEGRASEIFRQYGLIPSFRMVSPRSPPLPFLHYLIIVYAIPRNAYIIFCGARLFEEVKVMREKFIPVGDWQAITWETQELIIAEKAKALTQIQDLVDEVTMAFVRRYREYNPINLDAPGRPAFVPPAHHQQPSGPSRPPPQALPSKRPGGGGY